MTVTTKTDPDSKSLEHSCGKIPAKWFVSLDDRRISVPERAIRVTVIRAQAGVPDDKILVRDHNSAEDEVLDDNGHIDCAEGNVLYTMPRCDSPAPTRCTAPAKIAFSVDDRVEETLNRSQTGTTLLDLFGLERDRSLFRDYETPDDQAIKPEDHVNFVDGPVFYTRAHAPHPGLEIIVNHRTFTKADGVRPVMKAKEIAALVTTTPADFDTYAGKEAKGDPIPPEQDVHIKNCDVFTVVKREVVGGFLVERIAAELDVLKHGGAKVDLLEKPAAVIYRDIPAREGLGANSTDVLVAVPSGYPGSQIDGAYLPDGSPFLKRVVGQLAGSTLVADGRTWQLVSYHPHSGGGFPTWNPNLHGFHTYIDALIAWLARWK
jgi:hypothetical protein